MAGAVTVRDYEVPQNTAVTYRVYPVGSVGLAVSTSAITIADAIDSKVNKEYQIYRKAL